MLPSGYSFFGLTLNHKLDVYKQLLNISYNSKGSLSFTEVYNLPVYVRRIYIDEIQKYIKEENPKQTKRK